MKVYLIVASGKRKGFPILLQQSLFMLGSDDVCQLRSPLPGIAPRHCAVRVDDRKVFVRDLGSEEGTLINGSRMPTSEEWALHKGDRIAVGPLEFMVQFTELNLKKNDAEEWALKCLDGQDDEREVLEDLELMARKEDFANAAMAAQGILDRLSAQRGIVKGRLRVSREGQVTCVRLLDSFLVAEAEIALLRKELFDTLNQPGLRILIDCKQLARMSSAAAEMFGDVAHHLHVNRCTMAMCRLKPELQNIVQMLPMFEHVHFFRDKPLALSASW
jgi:anti-anti-sigma regulatory factor